jgi:hypothetical protein
MKKPSKKKSAFNKRQLRVIKRLIAEAVSLRMSGLKMNIAARRRYGGCG